MNKLTEKEQEIGREVAARIRREEEERQRECQGKFPHDFSLVAPTTVETLRRAARIHVYCGRCEKRFTFAISCEERFEKHLVGCPSEGVLRTEPCDGCIKAADKACGGVGRADG